jgi:two-component system, OmpR family, sensor histidine kinase KdpD
MGRDLVNPTTVALGLLLVVLLVAAGSRLWVAIATSIAAMLVFNFFFLPPVGTFTIADPQNWVALFAFLIVSIVASHLSSVARARTNEALSRRDEMARLFDLSRDVLLTDDSDDALVTVARMVARRFDLGHVAICRLRGARDPDWVVAEGGRLEVELNRRELTRIFRSETGALEYDADHGNYGTHAIDMGGRPVTVLPLRFGTKVVGLLAVTGGSVDAAALEAIGGLVAIAMERSQFLAERKQGELARQREELKSALLASIAHDLRTPLTTLRVAASNLQSSWLTDAERREQTELVASEVRRLERLFDNILEMARIDAGEVAAAERWVPVSEIVDAAREQVAHLTQSHRLEVQVLDDALVRLDPRLTASALSHLIENAAQHAPAGTVIEIRAEASGDNLLISVRDHGPGIAATDLPHVFERFYRGADARRRASGSGMGLSIARGLLAAERGRIWAENCAGGGASFTIAVPAVRRDLEAQP